MSFFFLIIIIIIIIFFFIKDEVPTSSLKLRSLNDELNTRWHLFVQTDLGIFLSLGSSYISKLKLLLRTVREKSMSNYGVQDLERR